MSKRRHTTGCSSASHRMPAQAGHLTAAVIRPGPAKGRLRERGGLCPSTVPPVRGGCAKTAAWTTSEAADVWRVGRRGPGQGKPGAELTDKCLNDDLKMFGDTYGSTADKPCISVPKLCCLAFTSQSVNGGERRLRKDMYRVLFLLYFIALPTLRVHFTILYVFQVCSPMTIQEFAASSVGY